MTGIVFLSWNVRLTKTAGLCYSKRYRNKFNVEMRSSRIELSSKVRFNLLGFEFRIMDNHSM